MNILNGDVIQGSKLAAKFQVQLLQLPTAWLAGDCVTDHQRILYKCTNKGQAQPLAANTGTSMKAGQSCQLEQQHDARRKAALPGKRHQGEV